ncbi:NAD(P)H-quinone oxidoreductase [Methylomarinum sp. Ch1-1]|uniref:NAD(P)H-quinone oxidoreductase n=1 Tax=Methylomarinum roseum TaxID=3067653 RepID=A0AAU7NUK3_9GAMM|nr:NAD(P)H-quinone oxidoreductase [Methylomarinum sp. Ch1-1]MDP4519297.1 NAD(P)H-quinone oxidoreductase [Methylomarinum sp. Ch1-1]
MIAIEITAPGGAGVLKPCERAMPIAGDNQVLIEVAAAGINRPDIMQRQGHYPPPPGASDIPGLEVAGTVVAIGNQVSHLKIGDRVCALVAGGGYAQYCLARASLALPIPETLDFIEAAALPETFFTVWSNVFDRGQLQAGETLLIHGGSGGIGTTAIQLAKAFGANVIATAGSAEKCRFCCQLGADSAIDYKRQDFAEEVGKLTDGDGVDVILDMVAGDYFPRNLKSLAIEGRLVQIAIQHGAKSEINLWSVMKKRLTITGSTLRGRDDEFKTQIAEQLRQRVWPLLASGTIKPVIHRCYPLTEAAAAHELMESGLHTGKIILTV